MGKFLMNMLRWFGGFFEELQTDGRYKASMKNICAFIAFLAFYIAVVKEVVLNHDFPDINGYWVSLLLGIAGVKAVGTIADKLISKADTK